MNPTNTSYAISGIGTIYEVVRNIITKSNTFPAKMFPKSRNENAINRVSSEMSSIKPIAKASGELKLINFRPYFHTPNTLIPATSTVINATTASAIVIFKSVADGYKNGTKVDSVPCIWYIPIEVTPGSNPNQFILNINRNIVVIIGKYFVASVVSPNTSAI